MGLLTADTPRETAIAWAFVLAQFALLGLILVLPAGDAWAAPSWAATAARWLEWLGMAVLVVGLVNLGRSLTPLPSPVDHGELRTGGLYRLVRHPIYSGIMGLAVGATVLSASVAVAASTAALVALFASKARWEEGKLRARYPGYAAYSAATPRFIPFWPAKR